MSRNGKIIIGMFSLVFVLLYNWTHTGGLLASYVRPEFVGYIAAAGIELSVVGLSLRIYELRTEQSDAKFHIVTLAAVVIVSALANIAEGYAVKFGESLTSANIGRLDAVQAIVSLSATGLLSLVVFALAEVVGHDIGASDTQVVAQDLSIDLRGLQVPSTGETDAPNSVTGDDTGYNASQSRQNGTSSDFGMKPDALGVEELSEAPSAVMERDTIEARLAQVQLTGKYTVDMVNCLLAVPEAKPAQLAAYIGCSRQHVDNTIKRWEQDKKISKNGQVKFIEPVNN